jgi:hypothetical protein
MTGGWPASDIALAAGGATTGLMFGLVHFAALRRTVDFYGNSCRLAAVVLTLARLLAAIVFFGFAARLGALPLLSAFLGFLAARARALRAARSNA